MGRLIIVSNRLPFSLDISGVKPVLRQSSGGLVSAIKSYFEKKNAAKKFNEKIWVGSVDFSPHEWDEVSTKPNDNFKIEPVFIEQDVYHNYYNGFSNSTLWPLFHYFPLLAEYDPEYYEAYIQVNFLFADKLLSIVKDDDVIWVHDYQLMLLPQILRKKNLNTAIGFFLHIPFPSYEIFRLLPTVWKTTLVQGILGADLIGFHTHDYVGHFIQSAKMIVGVEERFNTIQYDNRLIKTDQFPIGIDYDKFQQAARDKQIQKIGRLINQKFPYKIIFSVDRLDYSKGLMYRLEAFQEFLERYPEWISKVIFILNIIPSRDSIPAYNERKKQIEERIGTLNGRFSTLEWQPIIYRYNHLSFEELCALYQAANVALITPLRDGMNLVAKEFVASCTLHNGVLILSELTGAASELNEALLVNPVDSTAVANAINTALVMPEDEQRQRMQLMQRRLKKYDVVTWANDFLDGLNNIKEEQKKVSIKILSKKNADEILTAFNKAQKRCILLDYDGTLSPLTRIPSEATPDFDLLSLLEKLSQDRGNEIVVISGRDADTLDTWLGGLQMHLVAEHGAFIKYKNGKWEQQMPEITPWKHKVRPILELFVTRCTGSLIEEKRNTLTWHYRNTHPELGFIRSRELLNTLLQFTANTSLQVIDGNKVIEIRQLGADKGVTALKLINHFKPDFTLCIGDDVTDEDMFKALNDMAITIKIGIENSSAQFNLRSQQEVAPFLRRFIKSFINKGEYSAA